MGISSFFNEINYRDFNSNAYINNSKSEFENTKASNDILYEYNDQFKTDQKLKTSGKIDKLVTENVVLPAVNAYKNKEKEIRKDFMDTLKTRAQDSDVVAKRFSVLVNGNKVDVMIAGKKDQLNNGRWILHSNPNMASYEQSFSSDEVLSRMKSLGANYIFWNYPGVAGSEGAPNDKDMVSAYKAILHFLEDKENGIGANEIVAWGTSIGGGVQGKALEDYPLKDHVHYVFVKDQTFADFQEMPDQLIKEMVGSSTTKHIGTLSKAVFGGLAKNLVKDNWGLRSIHSSKQLKHPEVIIQNATTDTPTKKEEIIGDGVISAQAALATKLLGDKTVDLEKKEFVGVKSEHTTGYSRKEERRIVAAVRKRLDEQNVASAAKKEETEKAQSKITENTETTKRERSSHKKGLSSRKFKRIESSLPTEALSSDQLKIPKYRSDIKTP